MTYVIIKGSFRANLMSKSQIDGSAIFPKNDWHCQLDLKLAVPYMGNQTSTDFIKFWFSSELRAHWWLSF